MPADLPNSPFDSDLDTIPSVTRGAPTKDAARAFLRDARGDRLPQLALAALAGGDLFRAFALADRWCRESRPNVPSLLLRAEASQRLGHPEHALVDLERALELEPLHRGINVRLLEWGSRKQKLKAAESLARIDPVLRMRGLRAISEAGAAGAGSLLAGDGRISGWAAWRQGGAASLRFQGDATDQTPLTADPAHPLSAAFGHACDIALQWPAGAPRLASLIIDGIEISRVALQRAGEANDAPEPPLPNPTGGVTIIVPVYDDEDSTRLCLESVDAALAAAPDAQALIIDDASPNPAIAELLGRFAEQPRLRLRANPENLGFIGAVNRALGLVREGDVILLNADTIVPADLVAALQAIARADPTIGTINPLSNNGEFVSFPEPFRSNRLDEDRLGALREAARSANPAEAIDIPSGTGFCLYVTRACLDAVGALSADFRNGYLEDADFGLRAREAGFRNVCAPSVFVAHRGSRSFGSQKLALVARNAKTLARKFPDYESECRAYVALDPLAKARANVEALWTADTPRRLIVGPRRIALALQERARRLAEEETASLVVTVQRDGPRWEALFRGYGEAAPKSLRIRLDGAPWQNSKFSLLLRGSPHDRIEVSGLSELPDFVMEDVFSLSLPVDLLLVDASPKQDAGTTFAPPGDCAAIDSSAPCDECRRRRVKDPPLDALGRWARARTRCAGVVALDDLSARHWRGLHPRASISSNPPEGPGSEESTHPGAGAERAALGVLLPIETPATLRLLLALADGVAGAPCDVFVFGRTSLDDRLIARGLFVVGPVASVETARVAAQYRISRYLLPYRLENYWVLESFRATAPAPAAYFDWSFGAGRVIPPDLGLDPRICDDRAARAVCGWLRRSIGDPS